MKLPNLAIIFIIIILPLSVVLSTYMQLQIDVLNKKQDYSTKLLDATYDGILSFELNSLSLDNVAGESVKSYVQDAVSTFFTTMAINMGSSGAEDSMIQSYVPAILFTTYDGYYIYSPVKTDKVLIDYDNSGMAVVDDMGEVLYDDGKDGYINPIKDNETYSTDGAALEYNYMVKPFIYYSGTYSNTNNPENIRNGDYILVVNYSLDNHVALYGRYGDGSETRTISKSGYLINLENTKIDISGDFYVLGSYEGSDNPDESEKSFKISYNSLDEEKWIDLIECYEANYQNGEVVINKPNTYIGDEQYQSGFVYGDNGKYIIRGHRDNKSQISGKYQIINKYTEMNSTANRDNGGEAIIDYTLKLEEANNENYINVSVNGCEIKDRDAKEYYLKAYFFSNWVQREFGEGGKAEVKISDIKTVYDNGDDQNWTDTQIKVNNQGIEEYTGDDPLFQLDNPAQDPEKDDSIFTQHKRQVIQNSIQYNLNSAISTYNEYYSGTTDFSMPVFTADDWDKILTKVSMATFMQGVPCGGSIWGDYAIATSTNNKVFVNKTNLFFISDIDKKSDMISSYHTVDCKKLYDEVKEAIDNGKTPEVYADMSFEYAYDASEEQAQLFVLKEGDKYKKYYMLGTEWYTWNGQKIPDTETSLLNQINTSRIQVRSAYVELDEDLPNLRKQLGYLVYDNGYQYFKYGKEDENGYLVKFEADVEPGYDPTKTEETSLTDSVTESVLLYDHMNVDCYWCMMSANYESFDFMENYETDEASKAIATAWYTYIAKYKNNQFNMTDAIQR